VKCYWGERLNVSTTRRARERGMQKGITAYFCCYGRTPQRIQSPEGRTKQHGLRRSGSMQWFCSEERQFCNTGAILTWSRFHWRPGHRLSASTVYDSRQRRTSHMKIGWLITGLSNYDLQQLRLRSDERWDDLWIMMWKRMWRESVIAFSKFA
jgi:hypothetical protein